MSHRIPVGWFTVTQAIRLNVLTGPYLINRLQDFEITSAQLITMSIDVQNATLNHLVH